MVNMFANGIPVATLKGLPPWDKSDVTLWAPSPYTLYGIEPRNNLDVPLQMGSKAGHALVYTVGAFEVTHNHVTKVICNMQPPSSSRDKHQPLLTM